MDDVKALAGKLNDLHLWKIARPGLHVNIAANRRDRCNLFELGNDLRCANIARMDDVL